MQNVEILIKQDIYLFIEYMKSFDSVYIFEQFHERPVVMWNAIIQAYTIHGNATEVLTLFEAMQKQHIKPSDVTFVCLLSACSHTGLVKKAWELFCLMKSEHGIDPDSRHQACMVDVWAR
jgi:pentatricopeptide repeat protein